MAFPTNANQVQAFAGAMYGVQVGSVTMAQVNNDIISSGGLNKALNSYYTASFGSLPTATVATTVATNLGLTGDALAAGSSYIAAQLNAAAAGARGEVISNILNLFAGLASDATFGAAATAWNAKVDVAAAYTGSTNVAIGAVVATSSVFTLTTGADSAGVGSASNAGLASQFRFTSNNETVDALTSTTAGGDTLIDASTSDNDVFSLTATGAMTALTAVNIETANVNFASGTTASAIFTNFSGLKAINVSGAVAGTVEDAGTATIALNGYKRVATVDIDSLAGTASAGTADVLNLSVSGTTYGTTAATRSGFSVTIQSAADATDGTLETLNITSTGEAANVYSLAKDADTTFSTVNLLGATEQTLRVEHNDITGVSVVGTAATGDVNLRVNREGDTTTATNAANFTDIDNLIIADDATSVAAALVLSSVKSGQKITVVDDMATSSSITVQGAATATPAASLTIVLDNDTVNTDTDIGGSLDIQNVTTLNLQSSGFATTSTADNAENALTLQGDFSTVTITGDTSLDMTLAIEGAGSLGTTTRAVTVNASGMTGTAYVELDVSGGTYNTYTITGTSNADVIVGGVTANTLNGGDGNDAITGGAANDTINGGAGNDTVTTTAGTDTVTLGDGVDTIVLVGTMATTAAVQEVQTITFATAGTSSVAQGYVFRILGEDVTSITQNIDASPTTAEFEAALTAAINASAAGVAGRVSAADDTGVVVTFAATEGDVAPITVRKLGAAITAASTSASTANSGIASVVQGTAGAIGDLVDIVVADFTSSDLINTSTNLSLSGGGYFEGAISAAVQATEYGIMVITDQAYATIDLVETAIETRLTDAADTDMIVVFLNSTTGIAQAFYDSDIDTDGAATTNSIATFTGITTLTQLAAAFSEAQFV